MISDNYLIKEFSFKYSSDWNDEQVDFNITITSIPSYKGLLISIYKNSLPDFNSSKNL